MKYRLPALAVQPPLLLAISIGKKPKKLAVPPKAPTAPVVKAEVINPLSFTSPFQRAAQHVDIAEPEADEDEEAFTDGQLAEAVTHEDAADEKPTTREADTVAAASREEIPNIPVPAVEESQTAAVNGSDMDQVPDAAAGRDPQAAAMNASAASPGASTAVLNGEASSESFICR